jgi:hypothetical protein
MSLDPHRVHSHPPSLLHLGGQDVQWCCLFLEATTRIREGGLFSRMMGGKRSHKNNISHLLLGTEYPDRPQGIGSGQGSDEQRFRK